MSAVQACVALTLVFIRQQHIPQCCSKMVSRWKLVISGKGGHEEIGFLIKILLIDEAMAIRASNKIAS